MAIFKPFYNVTDLSAHQMASSAMRMLTLAMINNGLDGAEIKQR